jgi:hypothetical protein
MTTVFFFTCAIFPVVYAIVMILHNLYRNVGYSEVFAPEPKKIGWPKRELLMRRQNVTDKISRHPVQTCGIE